MGNQELFAIKLTLEEWRHWLGGMDQSIIVWTNIVYKNLVSSRSTKRLNCPQARKALFLLVPSLTYPPQRNLILCLTTSHLPNKSLLFSWYPRYNQIKSLLTTKVALVVSGSGHSGICGGLEHRCSQQALSSISCEPSLSSAHPQSPLVTLWIWIGTGLPNSHGKLVILTIVDHFSKVAHFVTNLPSAFNSGDGSYAPA